MNFGKAMPKLTQGLPKNKYRKTQKGNTRRPRVSKIKGTKEK